jgi:hypothetical protein
VFWWKNYGTSWKITGLRPGEVNEVLSVYLILPATLRSGVYLASHGNEYQKQKRILLMSRAWPVHKADNLSAIYELIF